MTATKRGRKPTPDKPATGVGPSLTHGTLAGARRHYRRGEKPCVECLAGQAEYERARRAAARQEPRNLDEAIVDVISTYQPVSVSELPTLVGLIRPDVNDESVRRAMYRVLKAERVRKTVVGLTV